MVVDNAAFREFVELMKQGKNRTKESLHQLSAANVTYGNGVLVVALPISETLQPARLTMDTVGPDRGERTGNSGQL